MPLTSMKLTPKEAKKMETISEEPSEYPWGLTLSLEKESLNRLKMSLNDHDLNDVIHFQIKTKVSGISTSKYSDSDESENLSLQVTDMGLIETPAEPKRLKYEREL